MGSTDGDGVRGSDLGELLSRMLTVVVEAEAPILEDLGLSMWEYVVLGRLADEDGLSQKELARRSRRDPTRLIAHLDALAARGLVEREVDPADRRHRVITLTAPGRALTIRARDRIRRMEHDLLGARADDLRSALEEGSG